MTGQTTPLLAGSEAPWDFTVTGTVRLMAGLGVATELPAAALTAVFVALVRLRRWWHVITAALILVAAVRMMFAPAP
ncbi:hypothetical protein [Streptomyces sp. NPDC057428]|uniref:hypothetical protein n=1 Tax=Streptomyces sp. NPDC057428 TaxID=3346129 RepID=UPI0036C84A6F